MPAPQQIAFNIIGRVRVRLTKQGKAIYAKYIDDLKAQASSDYWAEIIEGNRVQPDADGYHTFRVYMLMHIFGGANMPSGATTSLDIPFHPEVILMSE